MKKFICMLSLILTINTSFAPKTQEDPSADQGRADIYSLAQPCPLRPAEEVVPLLAERKRLLQPKRLFAEDDSDDENENMPLAPDQDLTVNIPHRD